MMNKKQFFIELKAELHLKDFSNLRLLYTPIIGLQATTLFEMLYDYFDLHRDSRTFYSFLQFKKVLKFSELEFDRARKKLEAVGLLRTFEKGDNETFILRLNTPLTPSAFKANKFLYNRMIARTNEIYFERIEMSRQARHIAKDEYAEITTKYQDVFDLGLVENGDQNTLEIPLPSVKSKDDAMANLVSPQFVFYLTKRRVSPSQLQIFQNLQNQGLSSKALNMIIDYSFTVNNKIVANHIKKIAEDFAERDIKDPYSVAMELKVALESRTNKKRQMPVHEQEEQVQNQPDRLPKIESKQELDQEWEDIIDSIGGI